MVVGLNVRFMVQDAPGAKLPGQPVAEKSPVAATPWIASAAVPLLINVTVFAALVLFCG
jgi:hypothetical protein